MSTVYATSGGNHTITPSGGTLNVAGDLNVSGTITAASTSIVTFTPETFLFTERAYNASYPYIYTANTASTSAAHGKCYFTVAETLSTYYLKVSCLGQFNTAILRLDIQDADSSTTIGGSFPYDHDTYSASDAKISATITGISLTAGTKYQLVLSTNGRNASNVTDYQIYLYNNGITLGVNLNGF